MKFPRPLDGEHDRFVVDAPDGDRFVDHALLPFGRGPDEDGREIKDGGFLRQGAGIRENGEGVLLQLAVLKEAEGPFLADERRGHEAPLLELLPGPGVDGEDDRHPEMVRCLVERGIEPRELLGDVDVLLPMGRHDDVLALLEAELLQDIAALDLFPVGVYHLKHRRARDEGPVFPQPLPDQVIVGEMGVGHVDVAHVIDDDAVGHLRHVPVPAAVPRLHVEDRDLEPFRGDGREGGVRVPQDENRLGPYGLHQIVRLRNDKAHRLAEVLAHARQKMIGLPEAQLIEEDLAQLIVVALARVGKDMIEFLIAFLDDFRQTDDLGPGPEDRHELKLGH